LLLVNVHLTLLNSHKSFSKLAHRGGKDHSLSLSIAMRRLPSETCSFVSRMMCANDDRPVCASTKTTAEGLAESPGLVAAKIYQHSEVALPTPQPNPTQPPRPSRKTFANFHDPGLQNSDLAGGLVLQPPSSLPNLCAQPMIC